MKKIVLTIPSGTEIEKNRAIGKKLMKGDRVRILKSDENTSYAQIDIETMTRLVPRTFLKVQKEKLLNPVTGKKDFCYTLRKKKNSFKRREDN